MGNPILVIGASSSGKSTSLRNFEPNEVGILNVAGKKLPFRKKLPTCNTSNYDVIKATMRRGDFKTYVIDDSQFLMAFESFDHAKEVGYTKFTNMAVNFRNLIKFIVEELPDNVNVYLLHHTEMGDDGRLKAKTLGKMLDNQLTLEGLFTIVLLAEVEGNEHWFLTNSDGTNPAKTPMDMFAEKKIPNDLKMVDQTIREYYGMEEPSNDDTGTAEGNTAE